MVPGILDNQRVLWEILRGLETEVLMFDGIPGVLEGVPDGT